MPMKPHTVLSLLIVLLSATCRHAEEKKDTVRPLMAKVIPPDTGFVSLPVHTIGILGTSEELKLSFKTGGIVARIFVREGDKVRKGDILASLNLLEIKANAEQAGIAYDKALRDFTRADTLFKQGALSLEKKQNAETALDIAKRSQEIAQFNLRHSRIEAPDNGIIMKQFVKENELVSSGYPLFLFGTSGRYWKVKAGLSDRDIIKINPGDSAEVMFDAFPGVRFTASVDLVGEMSDPYTGTYETELTLKDAGYRLASGFVASADIYPSGKKPYIMIPVGSIIEADGQQGYIYYVTVAGTARKIKIEIVSIIGTMAAVNGIPPGVTEVVSEGTAYLRDGAEVEIIR
jgi:membrane fusion protein, multidrug efflux system